MSAPLPVAAHFHDTRGLGLANVLAAFNAGCREFDASLGGLGGCPYAPGATGNIVLEDTAFLFESMGCDTGIDIDALVDGARDRRQGAARGDALRRHRQGRPAAQLPPGCRGGANERDPTSPERFAQMLKDAGLDPRHDPERFEELREGTRFLDAAEGTRAARRATARPSRRTSSSIRKG